MSGAGAPFAAAFTARSSCWYAERRAGPDCKPAMKREKKKQHVGQGDTADVPVKKQL
jgi:hypothetical protein